MSAYYTVGKTVFVVSIISSETINMLKSLGYTIAFIF